MHQPRANEGGSHGGGDQDRRDGVVKNCLGNKAREIGAQCYDAAEGDKEDDLGSVVIPYFTKIQLHRATLQKKRKVIFN